MPISYHHPPEQDSKGQPQPRELPQNGVQTCHVATMVALLVAILVAILILVPVFTQLESSTSNWTMEEGTTPMFNVTSESVSLNRTETLALQLVNEMVRLNKVEIKDALNVFVAKKLMTFPSDCIACAKKVVTNLVHDDHVGELAGGLAVNNNIFIRARFKPRATMFGIDFLVSDGINKAMQIKPWQGRTDMLNFSSLVYGIQQSGHRSLNAFPTAAMGFIEMIIRCDVDAFHVTVNSVHQVNYAYLSGLGGVTGLSISGDLEPIDIFWM